jgi:hypothetical protein
MELDLLSIFGLLCTALLIGWDPATPLPPHLGSYARSLLASQDRRHLFVTPYVVNTVKKGAPMQWEMIILRNHSKQIHYKPPKNTKNTYCSVLCTLSSLKRSNITTICTYTVYTTVHECIFVFKVDNEGDPLTLNPSVLFLTPHLPHCFTLPSYTATTLLVMSSVWIYVHGMLNSYLWDHLLFLQVLDCVNTFPISCFLGHIFFQNLIPFLCDQPLCNNIL